MTEGGSERVPLNSHSDGEGDVSISSNRVALSPSTDDPGVELTSNSARSMVRHLRWAVPFALLAGWALGIGVTLPRLHARPEAREGFNLVYWTPHKTGSTSMRLWLKSVADKLELKVGISHKYPNKLHEDHHARARRMGLLRQCGFMAGHIRVTPVHSRHNELLLGAVVSTIREPYKLLASKYFHRTKGKLNKKALKSLKDPSSKPARRWFFYFNDLDPCEQLRYYDGLYGCNYETLGPRIQAIADRIDCVIDTDDHNADLGAICARVGLNETDGDCPKWTVANRKRELKYYRKLLKVPHIVKVMERSVAVTAQLRNSFMKRRCRFLDDPEVNLRTPGMEPPNWPFKGCNEIHSTLQEGADEDAPENDETGDSVLEVEPLGYEGQEQEDDDINENNDSDDGGETGEDKSGAEA